MRIGNGGFNQPVINALYFLDNSQSDEDITPTITLSDEDITPTTTSDEDITPTITGGVIVLVVLIITGTSILVVVLVLRYHRRNDSTQKQIKCDSFNNSSIMHYSLKNVLTPINNCIVISSLSYAEVQRVIQKLIFQSVLM